MVLAGEFSPNCDGADYFDEIANVIRRCGRADFARHLLLLVSRQVVVDHLSILIFDQKLVPHLVAAESRGRTNLARKAGKAYEASYSYRFDPNTSIVRSRDRATSRTLMRLKAADIGDEVYRLEIYREFDLLDRVSLIDHVNGRWFTVNFYRKSATGEFTDSDIDGIRLLSEVISALLESHFALIPPVAWRANTRPSIDSLEKVVRSVEGSLSTREIQVCARALLGMTSRATGIDLSLQTPTISTLRKRAYTKMHISSLNELFSLCLSKTMEEPLPDDFD